MNKEEKIYKALQAFYSDNCRFLKGECIIGKYYNKDYLNWLEKNGYIKELKKQEEVCDCINCCLPIIEDQKEVNWLLKDGYIEEIVEEKAEDIEWKIGDYAVANSMKFIKIYQMDKLAFANNIFKYNGEFRSTDLRKPTQEELKLYFR